MKRFIISVIVCVFLNANLAANGVCIKDATQGIYLTLTSSKVDVAVENQIAIVTTTQVFRNDLGSVAFIKYGFPLPEDASALSLQWQIGGQWYSANIQPSPPDTSLPGSGDSSSVTLNSYLGKTPLFFDFPQLVLPNDSLTVELTYTAFLPYAFGDVHFNYPNDYTLLQGTPLDEQSLHFRLNSARTINLIQVLSNQPVQTLTNTGQTAIAETFLQDVAADEDYEISYTLATEETGLYGFSTFLADSLVPDGADQGFFTFVVEPDNATATMNKVFTLILDRSGSMDWENKLAQVKDATGFILNNFNPGDRFNIIDFATTASTFRNQHALFTDASRDSALAYIEGISAGGITNISDAFDLALPQFSTANDSTANTILFLTDGTATAGIINTNDLLNHIDNLVNQTGASLAIHCVGIGEDADAQLLNLLAANQNGMTLFPESDNISAAISDFYLNIRNPLLLDIGFDFGGASVGEVYSSAANQLYAGQQMFVSGRYLQGSNINVTMSGQAFGQPLSYQYPFHFSDSTNTNYQFLTKIWAKQKIEALLVLYFSLGPNSPSAMEVRDEIVNISIAFGVISPFTRFGGGNPLGIEELASNQPTTIGSFELLGNYPNPFNPETTIQIKVHSAIAGIVRIKIYNTLGQLVRVLEIAVNGAGIYEIKWDGKLANGIPAASGQYIYVVDLQNTILAKKMLLVK